MIPKSVNDDSTNWLTPTGRQQVMQKLRDEFHATSEQVEQQKRDSWKPQGRPDDGGEWGRKRSARPPKTRYNSAKRAANAPHVDSHCIICRLAIRVLYWDNT